MESDTVRDDEHTNSTYDELPPMSDNAGSVDAPIAGQPDLTFDSFLKMLNIQTLTLSLTSVLKYAMLTVGFLILALYLFPGQIVLVLLLLVLIVLLIARVILKKFESKTHSRVIATKPINIEKLQRLRERLARQRTEQ